MPLGTCRICGCTDAQACEGGCWWMDEEEEHCSQCVCWLRLKKPNPYAGAFPYELVPVRTLEPVPTTRLGAVWPVDVRRISREDLARVAFTLAPLMGRTAEEFLDQVSDKGEPFVILHASVELGFVAKTPEEAVRMADEFRATGWATGARPRLVTCPTVERRGQGRA